MTLKIKVREISTANKEWEELIHSSRQNILFVDQSFLNIWTTKGTSNHLMMLGCYDESEHLVGGQAIIHRKFMGVRIQGSFNISYRCTPILAGHIRENSPEQYEILSALARETRKKFPYLKVEFHPSLTDTRAYLNNGWHAEPQYAHTWDLRNVDAILQNMHHKKRSYVRKALENYEFNVEQDKKIIDEFLRLYTETMAKFSWCPSENWSESFHHKANWLLDEKLLLPCTCRTKTGQLISVALVILSPENRTAYGWLIGYDHAYASHEIPASLQYYSAKILAANFDALDLGDGPNANLFAYKDSLGTASHPFWVLTTKDTKKWIKFLDFLRDARQSLKKLFRQRIHAFDS
jgi:hypothetical protein